MCSALTSWSHLTASNAIINSRQVLHQYQFQLQELSPVGKSEWFPAALQVLRPLPWYLVAGVADAARKKKWSRFEDHAEGLGGAEHNGTESTSANNSIYIKELVREI